jgi:hypothetical protein
MTDHQSGSGVGVSALQELIQKWRERAAEWEAPCEHRDSAANSKFWAYRSCADGLEAVLSSLQPPTENSESVFAGGSPVPVREPEATPKNDVVG